MDRETVVSENGLVWDIQRQLLITDAPMKARHARGIKITLEYSGTSLELGTIALQSAPDTTNELYDINVNLDTVFATEGKGMKLYNLAPGSH